MESINIKVNKDFNELKKILEYMNIEISAPHQTKGSVFNIIPEKNIAGFDLFVEDRKPDIDFPEDMPILFKCLNAHGY